MTNEEAIKQIQGMVVGAEWLSDYQLEALDMAIESLENNGKLAEDLQNCLDMYKKKKAEVEALKQSQVIHCKDCKHFQIDGNFMFCNSEGSMFADVTENDFCSYAERRTE